MLVLIAVGAVGGATIVAAVAGAHLSRRTQDAFEAGRQAQRDGIAPQRPIDGLPGWERSERGFGAVDHVLGVGIIVGLVLAAPTLRWWIIPAALLTAVLVAGMSLTGEES